LPPGSAFDPLAAWISRECPGHDPGHSGLFSNARDLTVFCQALLYPHLSSVGEMGCVAELLLTSPPNSANGTAEYTSGSRTRGFVTMDRTSGGTIFYHTGYTGTLMWMNSETGVS